MRAIILAAGLGRRMRALTASTHKALLEVGDRAVIDWVVDPLLAHGVTDLTVVTGYRSDELRAHLRDTYPDSSFEFVHNERYAQTNNIHSLALGLEHRPPEGDLLVVECDLILEASAVQRLLASPHPNVALLDRYRSGMDGTVVQVDDGIVTHVFPPHLQGNAFDFGDKFKTLNLYRFSQEFCVGPFKRLLSNYTAVLDENQYYELILGILIYLQKETIHAAVLDGEKWAEIDDPNDLAEASFKFNGSSQRATLDRAYGGLWNYDVQDFCYLRNPYFPTSSIISELRSNLPDLLHNYGSRQEIVDEKLAYHLVCDPTKLVALNGLSQAYPLFAQAWAEKKALIPSPTFGEYTRTFPRAGLYYDEVGVEPSEIERRAADRDLVALVNPNNPTGSTVSSGWVYDFAAARPQTTVLVDESFVVFSDESSLLGRLEEEPLPNLVLAASMGKALGVPGLRLGYVYSADRALTELLRSSLPIWNLNALAENFLEIILKHGEAIEESYAATRRARAALADLLASSPVVDAVYPSGGNFVLVRLGLAAERTQALVESLLAESSIYVKDVSGRLRDDAGYLRIAVRTYEENSAFVVGLDRATRALGSRGRSSCRGGSRL